MAGHDLDTIMVAKAKDTIFLDMKNWSRDMLDEFIRDLNIEYATSHSEFPDDFDVSSAY